MSKETDIGTDEAYVKAMLKSEAVYATSYVDLQRELNKANRKIGWLEGGICIGLLVLAFLMFAIDSKIEVNEVLINNLRHEKG